MGNSIPAFLFQEEPIGHGTHFSGRVKISPVDRTIGNAARNLKILYLQAESADRRTLISDLNSVTKVIAFIYLVVIVSVVSDLYVQVFIACGIFILYCISGIKLMKLYRNIFLVAFFFGFLVSAPAAVNLITPGDLIVRLYAMQKPMNLWIYHIPAEIGITWQGCVIVFRIFLKVFNSIALSFLLVYSTPFPRLLKAFKTLAVPDSPLMVVWLAYKFIFILCKTIDETFLAVKSRFIGEIKSRELRGIFAGRIYHIYARAQSNYQLTYSAMISRGYEGKIMLVAEAGLKTKDFIVLLGVAAIGAGFLLI